MVHGAGSKLTPSMMAGFARRGGQAWINSDLTKSLPAMMVAIADLTGPTAGQSMESLNQVMMGSMTFSRQQGDIFKKLGLVDESKMTPTGFGKSRYQLDPGAIKGSLEHSGDVPGWIRDVVWPAVVAAAGGNAGLEASLLAKIFPNRNATRMGYMFGDEGFRDQIAKDTGITGGVMPLEQLFANFLKNNPKGVDLAFAAQWTSMWEAIGKPVAELQMSMKTTLIPFFETIAKLANENPDAIKNIAFGLGLLGAFMMTGGAILMVSALPLIATGLTGLAAAVGLYAAFHWETIASGMRSFIDMLNKLQETISGFVGGIGSWLYKHINYTEGGGGFGPGGMVHHASLGASAGSLGGSPGGVPSSWFAGGGREAGLQPEFRSNLDALMAEGNASGHPLGVTEGYRSYAAQVAAYRNKPGLAAFPGHSNHGRGLAADIHGDLAWAHAHAASHWLRFPMWPGRPGGKREPWHVEPFGGGSKSGQTHETNIYLDGKKIASNTAKHIVRGMTHPTSAPYHDGRHSWTPPDQGLVNI